MPPPPADTNKEARPLLMKKGYVAWAGGQGGPELFIALADHPEWPSEHTVWGQISPESEDTINSILLLPSEQRNAGHINTTNLVHPLPFIVTPWYA